MNVRQAPPRILYIATWIVVIVILVSLQWLITAPPADFANYQPLFKAAFDFIFGSIFIACGLFYNSWFAKIMGAHNAPGILHRTRSHWVYRRGRDFSRVRSRRVFAAYRLDSSIFFYTNRSTFQQTRGKPLFCNTNHFSIRIKYRLVLPLVCYSSLVFYTLSPFTSKSFLLLLCQLSMTK